MVLVTDGQNTEPHQSISDIQADIVESGTKVVTIGFGCAFNVLSVQNCTVDNVEYYT
jgi:hypothetical protein